MQKKNLMHGHKTKNAWRGRCQFKNLRAAPGAYKHTTHGTRCSMLDAASPLPTQGRSIAASVLLLSVMWVL
jgi:hypothetical protein